MMKVRKFAQTLLMLLALGTAAYTSNLRAEDIDIYVDNAGSTGDLPNVLFVIENSANLSATSSMPDGCATGYADGSGAPSLGANTAGGVVQCALVDAIKALPDGSINIGIMSGNANGFATSRGCVGSEGGCLLYPLTTMNGTSKTELVNFIKSWAGSNTENRVGQFPISVQNVATDGIMQEVWAYYNGRTGRSGKSYSPSKLLGCQKNFVIYIANTDKTPSNDTGAASAALVAAGATTQQRNKLIAPAEFDPAICGAHAITEVPVGTGNNDWSENWGDEWARLMFEQDANTTNMEGMQNITSYTIGLMGPDADSCKRNVGTPALLQSMATVGGGKAFRAGNANEVVDALARTLNEVQAVNSVFSSASLPVSVNAEGSYLNQIFLGMFRPDTSGAPRWLGNLKQYQLIRNNAGQLVMGDACVGTGCPKPAITSGGTGFLAPGAVSFWTYKDERVEPDLPIPATNADGTPTLDANGNRVYLPSGFFRNDKKGTPLSGYDLADGEVVEKGGVAQQLRKQNLIATFTGRSGTTGNPRRVYTFCPDGTNCQDDLTHADNDFQTENPKIVANQFGSALTVPVQSITRSGSVATITTPGKHGFRTGSLVTIRNANQSEYNRTQTITILDEKRFTMDGLPDLPTPKSTVAYTVSVPGAGGSFPIASISRAEANTGSATADVTVTTTGSHPYVVGQAVQLAGVSPADYSGKTITSIGTNQFTFRIPVFPNSPAQAQYRVAHVPRTVPFSTITLNNGVYTVSTSPNPHKFHAGQTVTISGVTGGERTSYNKTFVIAAVPTTTSFTIVPSDSPRSYDKGGSVAVDSTAKDATRLTRNSTAITSTATVEGLANNWFGNGDEVDITMASTTMPAGESNASGAGSYVARAIVNCSAPCSSFTYTITTSPALPTLTTGASVSIPSAGSSVDVTAGNLTRNGATATITGVTAGTFAPNSFVSISGARDVSVPSTEAAYLGNWQITCTDANCTTFSFGPIPLNPRTPATGSNIQAYSGNTSPDKDVMIRWLRGEDNQGEEKGPGNGIKVRPSVHGDVLHSRPLVINYGDSRGIVVFYGSNDGVYRAVNGNQSQPIEATLRQGADDVAVTVPAGGELWGFILPEHFNLINRYRANAPELRFPGTFLATAQPKDYFVDGPTGVYQKMRADGTIERAIIYLTMRRGGRLIYALDVTEPMRPRRLWSISHQTAGFEELGQTWSRPRLTLLQKYKTTSTTTDGVTTSTYTPTPVIVFGAGYDPSQDNVGGGDPNAGYVADSMGRGIFVVDAVTGDKVFSASSSCPTSSTTCRRVPEMKYATPSDIAFVDRDFDGYTDKFYWGDLGGNVWRADVADVSVANWSITRVAALGCESGECDAGVTPRKFFFPPSVLSVRPANTDGAFDALSMVSGDREHPLRDGATSSSFNVQDRFFMVKDLGTRVNDTAANTRNVTPAMLDDATLSGWDGGADDKGFYISFIGGAWNAETGQPSSDRNTWTKGEKAVNAPVSVNGQIFFATNQPKDRNNTCVANLGTARAYAISPFTGTQVRNELAGGGLPPSAVTGLINITENRNGETVTTQEKFCIGCGLSGTQAGGTNAAPCTSALENCNIGTTIPKNLKRTYWYKK